MLAPADRALFRQAMRYVQPLALHEPHAATPARKEPEPLLRTRRQHAEGESAIWAPAARPSRRRGREPEHFLGADDAPTGGANEVTHTAQKPAPAGRRRHAASAHPGTAAASDVPTDQAREFLRAGCGPDLLRGLRRGKWIPMASLDLHGSTLEEAYERLDRFLTSCLDNDIRCVQIIHGKGFGSRKGGPVLKAAIRQHLSRLPVVQAWVESPAPAGGAGSVSALLRR